MRYLGLTAGVALLWCSLLAKGTRSSVTLQPRGVRLEGTDNSCPFPYERHSQAALAAGQEMPYLFGGIRRPECRNCDAAGDIAEFCRFQRPTQAWHFQHPAHICSAEQQALLLNRFSAGGFGELLELTPCDMWPFLRGRTLWVVGDSESLDLSIALGCFMQEFWSLKHEVTAADGDPELAAQFEAVRISPAWHDLAHCSALPEGTRLCFVRANWGGNVTAAVLPILFGGAARREDVIVVNFGLWYHDAELYAADLASFAELVASQREHFPNVLWKDSVPQHFDAPFGAYTPDLPGPPFVCRPVGDVTLLDDLSLASADPALAPVLTGLWRNEAAEAALAPAYVPIIRSWNMTVPLWDFHRSNVGRGMECGHYCHPSAPQAWVYALYKALQQHVQPLSSTSPATTLHLRAHSKHVSTES